jgi:hypothetical protein
MRRERSDSRRCHLLGGSATEGDGLEDFPFARKLGSASRLAPALHCIVGDKPRVQALSVVVWNEFLSKRYPDVFKELPYLRFWKTNDQSGEAR